jgi:hypothetical protein
MNIIEEQKHDWLFRLKAKAGEEPTIQYMQCAHCGAQVKWWKGPKDIELTNPAKDNIYCMDEIH